jgi:Txe/YoeB family toxin of Txe-Axe toxin-antitoxin module
MPEFKLKQLQYESDTWKRLLAFMMDENVHLKNRLSEVLKDGADDSMLNEMENFQNIFVSEDEQIRLLRKDISELEKLLVREVFEDGKIIKQVNKKLKMLRNNIVEAENKFSRLKSDFHSYLSENIIKG